jgi:hypothetical protein
VRGRFDYRKRITTVEIEVIILKINFKQALGLANSHWVFIEFQTANSQKPKAKSLFQ